ncbi:MAG: hypothetical protein KKH98_11205 [Spirochaetes bacterium]|nr:hypothetical protein [Spirochaetota bacterium]
MAKPTTRKISKTKTKPVSIRTKTGSTESKGSKSVLKPGAKQKLDKNFSSFLNSLAKKGEKYSKIAKAEFSLMVLMEKRNKMYRDLGEQVYKILHHSKKPVRGDSRIKSLITEIEELEKKEASIKREVRAVQNKE